MTEPESFVDFLCRIRAGDQDAAAQLVLPHQGKTMVWAQRKGDGWYCEFRYHGNPAPTNTASPQGHRRSASTQVPY